MISLVLLLPLYVLFIQHERGGAWRAFGLVGLIAGPLDVLLNYTELALITGDFPRKGEYTFSKRLSRLRHNTDWRGKVANIIKPVLDRLAPSGLHIK